MIPPRYHLLKCTRAGNELMCEAMRWIAGHMEQLHGTHELPVEVHQPKGSVIHSSRAITVCLSQRVLGLCPVVGLVLNLARVARVWLDFSFRCIGSRGIIGR